MVTQTVYQVERGESLFKNEKGTMQRIAPTTKVCVNKNYNNYMTRTKLLSEHRIQVDEVDREFY